MKRMGDDPDKNSDPGADTTWTFNEKFGRKVMLLYHKLKNGCSDELPGSGNYRLFFLLEGAVRLKVGNDDEYLLGNGEFTLLPPGCSIVCSALVCSGYVIINCNRIKIGSNVSYLDELKKEGDKEITPCRQLPIRGRFMKVLTDFEYYPVSESMYPSLYDILFIYMRILYSKEELLSFLHPVLFDSRGKRRE
jgi:hypothetical protein